MKWEKKSVLKLAKCIVFHVKPNLYVYNTNFPTKFNVKLHHRGTRRLSRFDAVLANPKFHWITSSIRLYNAIVTQTKLSDQWAMGTVECPRPTYLLTRSLKHNTHRIRIYPRHIEIIEEESSMVEPVCDWFIICCCTRALSSLNAMRIYRMKE